MWDGSDVPDRGCVMGGMEVTYLTEGVLRVRWR